MVRKVLIVDDSGSAGNVLESTLSEAGYEVRVIANGRNARQLVEANHYDLLLVDLDMPRMDGPEFISEIRNMPGRRFLPIVVLSDAGRQARFSECFKAGASGCLRKPLEKDQVLSFLDKTIPY